MASTVDRSAMAPGPSPHSLLGNLSVLRTDHITQAWDGIHREYGDTFSLRFGPQRMSKYLTVTRSPEAIGHVLGASSPFTKTGHVFYETFRELLGKGLFSAYDDEWRWQRRVLSPLFTAKQSAAYLGLFASRSEEYVERWLAADRPVSLRSEILGLTLAVVTDMLFGAGRDDLAGKLERVFPIASKYVVQRSFDPFVLPRGAPSPGIRRSERAITEVYRLVDDVLATAGSDEASFVGRLRSATDPETGRSFSDADIRDQVLVFIAAGHDTTATALTMALQLLALHPTDQARAFGEIEGVGQLHSVADAERLTFTTAVIDETLRLYPSAPGTGRLAEVDTLVDGFAVPVGSNVFTNFWSLHRNPELYVDPEAFVPQRFIDTPHAQRPRHTFLPFGSGPRACIGAHTAVLEMQTALSVILSRAQVSAMTRDTPMMSAITLTPATPLPVRFNPR